MKKHIYTLWAFFILFSQSIAASVEVRSTHMTTGDGVANNSIRYIYQDSKGFIWMGTLNGLSRHNQRLVTFARPSWALYRENWPHPMVMVRTHTRAL